MAHIGMQMKRKELTKDIYEDFKLEKIYTNFSVAKVTAYGRLCLHWGIIAMYDINN